MVGTEQGVVVQHIEEFAKYYNWEANYRELDMINSEWIQTWSGFLGYANVQFGDKFLVCNRNFHKKYLKNSNGGTLERTELARGTVNILITYSYYISKVISVLPQKTLDNDDNKYYNIALN